MKELVIIELNNVRFHAYHGLFEEERRTGNDFVVNLRVEMIPASGTVTGIDETINYATLFRIVQEEMQQTRDLLETLTMEIAEHIHQSFPSVKKISISITKLNPPIAHFTGNVIVTYQKEF